MLHSQTSNLPNGKLVRGYLPMPPARSSELLHVALVVGDRKLGEEIRGCIHEVPVHVVFETPMLRPRQELVERIKSSGAQVVLLDFDTAADASAAVADIKCALPECHVLALGKTVEAQAILEAFRAGASDYLCPPLKKSLIAALGRIQADERKQQRQAAPPGGAILGILSAKGGCGATTIACHVAAELRRLTSEKVLLADLDLTAGVTSFLMKAERRHTIADAFENTERLDASYWSALVTKDRSGLDIVVAPPPAGAAPPAARVSETLQFLRSQYRFVVADLGRGLNPFIEAAVDEMDRVFVVATAEPPALHHARQMAEYFTEKRSPRVDARLILNRVSESRWQVAPEECGDLVGLPVCCEISNDYKELYDALIEGKLVPPKSRLGKDFTRAACAIARVSDGDETKPTLGVAPGWLKAAVDFLR